MKFKITTPEATITVNYSAILGATDGTISINNPINNPDPQFVDPSAGDYHLGASSNLINVGDLNTDTPTDVDGQLRPFDSIADVGADEFYGDSTCFANLNGTIYDDLQEAITAANEGDTVKVAGVCDTINTEGAGSQVLYLNKSITVEGGYTTANWDTPSTLTYLDAQNSTRVVYITSNITPTLAGFHISNGSVNDDGAGIYIDAGSKALIQNNFILNNTANNANLGGGIYVLTATVSLRFNTFYNNSAIQGGAIANQGGTITIDSNLFYQNTATLDTGPAYFADGGTEVLRYNAEAGHSSEAYVKENGAVTLDDTNLSPTDPGLEDPSSGDLHLQVTSPLIDQGNPANSVPDRDIEGDVRLAGRTDIGADEALPSPGVRINPDYQKVILEAGENQDFNHSLQNHR